MNHCHPVVRRAIRKRDKALRSVSASRRPRAWLEALQKQALQPVKSMNADELAELYAADTEKYAKIIREANIKID